MCGINRPRTRAGQKVNSIFRCTTFHLDCLRPSTYHHSNWACEQKLLTWSFNVMFYNKPPPTYVKRHFPYVVDRDLLTLRLVNFLNILTWLHHSNSSPSHGALQTDWGRNSSGKRLVSRHTLRSGPYFWFTWSFRVVHKVIEKGNLTNAISNELYDIFH